RRPWTKPMPWLRQEVPVPATEASPLGISLEALDARLPIGGKATAKLKLTRTAEVKGNVRLTLLTSQTVPKNPDGRTENVNRALRLEAAPTLQPNQTTAELKILVPADLPATTYEVSFRADILGPDNRTVVLPAAPPPRRLPASK